MGTLGASTMWVLLALPAGIAAGALVAFVWHAARALLRGRPVIVRPTCRRCGMVLRGGGAELPERCPECGTTTGRGTATDGRMEGAVAVGFATMSSGQRWLRRGAALASLLAALWIGAAIARTPIAGAHRNAVISRMPARMGGNVISDTREKRLGMIHSKAHTADAAGLRALQEEARSILREMPDSLRMWSVISSIVMYRIGRGDLSLEEARTLAAEWFPAPRAFASARVERGGELLVSFMVPYGVRDHWYRVKAIRLDGRSVQPVGQTIPSKPAPIVRRDALEIVVPGDLGPHRLEVDWESDLLDDLNYRAPALNAAAFGRGLAPRQETTAFTFEITAGPPEVPPLAPADPAIFNLGAESPYAVIMESGERASVYWAIPSLPILFGPGTFTLHIGDRAYPISPVPAAILPSFCMTGLAFAEPPAGGWPETARVEFTPASGPAMAPAGATEPLIGAWTAPVVFELRRWLTGPDQTNYQTSRVVLPPTSPTSPASPAK